MPQIGEKALGRKIGLDGVNAKRGYIYVACEKCGRERWVRRYDARIPSHCRSCNSYRRKTTSGYVLIRVYPDNPFFTMADKQGYVREHRLVMAQHLGRPLLRTEIVHHRPDVAKDDSRIEVLYLMPNSKDHSKYIPCSNCELKKEIRLLRWEVKQLAIKAQGALL